MHKGSEREMDVTFDVTSDPSPLLSATVLRLTADQQQALNATAETVLALNGAIYAADSDNQIAALAVVYQMNYMAEISDEAWGLHSERRGQRSKMYRTAKGQVMPRIAPMARELTGRLSDRGWATAPTSVR